MAQRRKKAGYHHGALRDVLLRSSLEIIEQQGVAALSLREVARQAGVTHGAPYFHFHDKRALLSAIADQGFEMLAHELVAARDEAVGTPRRALESIMCRYVQFAVAHPGHFRVMFRSGMTIEERPPETET